MSYRVVIPTAGLGSRLGSLTKIYNKSLINVANKSVISRIIENFNRDCEFVIPLGHKGKLVRDFLELAYPDLKFFFINVRPYEGLGSGLGLSLLKCERYLKEPFIFISCDTLVTQKIPPPSKNWMGYASKRNYSEYRTISYLKKKITSINEKGLLNRKNLNPYIGIAGIKNFQIFWEGMNKYKDKAIKVGEVAGLRSILECDDIYSKKFTWYDTGSLPNLTAARKAFKEKNDPNILDKSNENIWFAKDRVIKFSTDKKFIKNRFIRSKSLKPFVPKICAITENMYCYNKIEGEVLSKVVNPKIFYNFLNYCETFWKQYKLNKNKNFYFKKTCYDFYYKKTIKRLDSFFLKFNKIDGNEKINEKKMTKLDELFKKVNWDDLSNGLPGRFHGDLHFENVLFNKKQQSFFFIDWRQDFGGHLEIGDIYYDLAKILHGIIVSHRIILENKYKIQWNKNSINFFLSRTNYSIKLEKIFEDWCHANKYDFSKVRIITSLIYLNIASLHHYPYSLLLFALGKSMLKEELN